jgi:N-acetyl-anhydromuramyl-L-alanine amidase AmpD
MIGSLFSLNKISGGFLKDTKACAESIKREEAKELLNINNIIQVDFPDNQYFKEQTNKSQVVLHHTVSGQGVDGDIAWWRSTVERIGTALIVNWDGSIYQCFSSKYWSHHLGLKAANNVELNKKSIGIEIDAWGGLVKANDNKWYPAKWNVASGVNVPNLNVKPIENVQEYPNGYRGFYGFQKYTNAQIESVRKLLVYFGGKYNIPLDYNESMWDVSKDALSGKSGIWTHTSFRKDKSDCHMQNELINMLKSLK